MNKAVIISLVCLISYTSFAQPYCNAELPEPFEALKNVPEESCSYGNYIIDASTTQEQLKKLEMCPINALKVQGTNFTDLSPLNNLTSVTNHLIIEDNKELQSLNGLDSLMSVGGIVIRNNAKLNDINALKSISIAPERGRRSSIVIDDNDRLDNIDILGDSNPINSIYGFNVHFCAQISNNDSLRYVRGFDSLGLDGDSSITITINKNASLHTLSTFNDFVTSDTSAEPINLSIEDNAALAFIEGLHYSGVTKPVNDPALININIARNHSLQSLNLGQFSGTGSWIISGNKSLLVITLPDAIADSGMIGARSSIEISQNQSLEKITWSEKIWQPSSEIGGFDANDIYANFSLNNVNISVVGNTNLRTLDFLKPVKYIFESDVAITDNQALPTLDSLNNLACILYGGLVIDQNPLLSNIDGLSNLREVEGCTSPSFSTLPTPRIDVTDNLNLDCTSYNDSLAPFDDPQKGNFSVFKSEGNKVDCRRR